MCRLMLIAVVAVFLALPVWAQHGGGHAGGGHGGGFAGRGSFGAAGHVSSGTHSTSGTARGLTRAPSFSQRSFSNRGFSNRPFLHDGFRGSRQRGFRNCQGYGCWGYGYPWAYGSYYDPYWWGSSASSYDEDGERDRATANDMNEQSLEEQQMLHQEQADGDRDSYARSAPVPSAPQGAAIMPATVLIFRDQHKKEIQNYAIVGQTLWNFAPQHTEKIPLSDLDLPATTKANDDLGLTFRVPNSNEAQ
jgi:hypothetical protein